METNCIRCGLCVEICPAIPLAGLEEKKPDKLQEELIRFFETGTGGEAVLPRLTSCLECFKCSGVCPRGIDPLSLIEKGKNRARLSGLAPFAQYDPGLEFKPHRQALDELPEVLRKRITERTEPEKKGKLKYLFFPGCNVYKEPERLLKILDILDFLEESYLFLPGLENCCGDRFRFSGDRDQGEISERRLMKTIDAYRPEKVILWCPTCLVRLGEKTDGGIPIQSFFQLLLEKKEKGLLTEEPQPGSGQHQKQTVCLHEPCKTAYTKRDESHLKLLRLFPELTVREMKTKESCCGSGGFSWNREKTREGVTLPRLLEAVEAGAETLFTVCHYCGEVFTEEGVPGLRIENLADYCHRRMFGK